MEAFISLTSKFISLPLENIDTDQIIPARFLTQTHREGLGAGLFYDWRYEAGGTLRTDHILNQDHRDAHILVAGANFGCGSSREHAVWALQSYGFRVVMSPSIGDIFKSNALKNGLLALEIDPFFYQEICRHPEASLTVDLEQQSIALSSGATSSFVLEPFARLCLLQGVDQLGFLLGHETAIANFEGRQR